MSVVTETHSRHRMAGRSTERPAGAPRTPVGGAGRAPAAFVDALAQPAALLAARHDAPLQLLVVNDAFAALVGQPRAQLQGSEWREAVERSGSQCDDGQVPGADDRAQLADAVLAQAPRDIVMLLETCSGGGAAQPVRGWVVPCTADDAERVQALLLLQDHAADTEAVDDTPSGAPAHPTAEPAGAEDQPALTEHLAGIGTLAAGLGHDISNTLLPMRLRLDSIEKRGVPEESEADLRAIRQSMEHLRALCNSLRNLVVDPEDAGPSGRATDLSRWWAGAGPLLKNALPKHVALKADVPDDLPHARIAPHVLTQVVLDLFFNAGEVIEDEGVVRMEARADASSQRVVVRVSDNGPGMSPELQRRILQPFFTTKVRGLSTGLSLYRAHGMIRSAGGAMRIHSVERQGTTIEMEFAVVEPAGVGETPAAGRAVVAMADNRIAAYVGALLAASGCEVQFGPQGPVRGVRFWITDATDDALAAATRCREANPDCHVVAYGVGGTDWRAIGATVVDPATGLAALRQALRSATGLPGGGA